MKRNPRGARRSARVVGVVACMAAIALLAVPTAGTSGVGNGLFALTRVTKTGPLPACAQDLSNCGAANQFHFFVSVLNTNRLGEPTGRAANRTTLPNALVVESVEYRIFIDGAEFSRFTFTPPPQPSYRPWSGHWPSTATCGAPTDPCNVVTSPAVLAGELTTVFYGGWAHGAEEPNGTYVFRFIIRGTLEGSPIELQTSTPPIVMTD